MATVTYVYPTVGTVPPTAAQAFYENLVVADVVFADADTTALITHNFNLTTTAGVFGPLGSYCPTAVGTAVVAIQSSLSGLGAANTVSLNKAIASAGTGVGWTHRVVLQRPHSIITGLANKGV